MIPPLFSMILFFSAFISCQEKKNKNYPGPTGYDLNKPIAYSLPAELDEISGIIFYQKDSGFFAINDEKGWLYKIFLQSPLKIERWKFSDGGDYEDLSLADSAFYVLKSKGKLEKFSFSGNDASDVQTIEIPQPGSMEFETLFYDKKNNRLVAVCKECKEGEKEDMVIWLYDLATTSFSSMSFNADDILKQLGDKQQKRFKPSAGAIHPVTGEWYIISSVNKGLVILDEGGTVAGVYRLDPKMFKQPEGLTFTPKGDLVISNESADAGAANILFFRYRK